MYFSTFVIPFQLIYFQNKRWLSSFKNVWCLKWGSQICLSVQKLLLTLKRKDRQDDCPGDHWRRWRQAPSTTRAVTLTTFPFMCESTWFRPCFNIYSLTKRLFSDCLYFTSKRPTSLPHRWNCCQGKQSAYPQTLSKLLEHGEVLGLQGL